MVTVISLMTFITNARMYNCVLLVVTQLRLTLLSNAVDLFLYVLIYGDEKIEQNKIMWSFSPYAT